MKIQWISPGNNVSVAMHWYQPFVINSYSCVQSQIICFVKVVCSAEIATDDVNSSVMIADVKPFAAIERRGFLVRMNSDAVDHLS